MTTAPMAAAHERIVSLAADETTPLRGGARLRVTHGLLWLTIDGQLDDHFLQPGDRFTLDRGARAWLQAVDAPAIAMLVPDVAPSWAQRAAQALQMATRRLAGAPL